MRNNLLQRLDARREMRGPDECWPWVKGSIRIHIGPRKSDATELRRAAWLVEHGTLPGRYLHVEVRCGNAKCLNPAHLFMPTETERFWSKVRRGRADECWPWQATDIRGYGRFMTDDRRWMFAHRFAYHLATGEPMVESDVIMHSCDNPPCCNPRHLRRGTALENTRDMLAKGRAAWQKAKTQRAVNESTGQQGNGER